MSTFIAGMLPIVIFWLLPLTPMFYAAVAATLEALSSPVRREQRDPTVSRELAT